MLVHSLTIQSRKGLVCDAADLSSTHASLVRVTVKDCLGNKPIHVSVAFNHQFLATQTLHQLKNFL